MRVVWDWLVKKTLDYGWMMLAPLAAAIIIDLIGYWGPWRTAAIAVCCFLTIFSTLMFFRQERRRDQKRRGEEDIESLIETLDADERATLIPFHDRNTYELPMDHPAVAGLVGKGILVPAIRNGQMKRGNDGEMHSFFLFMLSDLGRTILGRMKTIPSCDASETA